MFGVSIHTKVAFVLLIHTCIRKFHSMAILPGDSKFTALMVAAINDHSDVVELLLDRGTVYMPGYTHTYIHTYIHI